MNNLNSTYIKRIKILYPDLNIDKLKIIGWGAGKEFSEYYNKIEVDIDYTICIYEENHGKEIKGIKVMPPKTLKQEDPENTLILVFSSWWFDAFRQIKSIGNYNVIRAFSGWSEQHEISFSNLNTISNDQIISKNICKSKFAILMQGPLERFTPMALKLTKLYYPEIPIILSTWDCSRLDILEQCKNYVNIVLTNKMPQNSGPNGLNLIRQQAGVIHGLNELKKLGVKYALKTRTDSSMFGDCNFYDLVKLTIQTRPSEFNLKSKILFSGQNSWKYIPYHLTDQYQFGQVIDLLNYWSFDSSIELTSMARDEAFYYFSLSTPESAICRSFMARNSSGHQLKKYPFLSIAKYWGLMKNEFGFLPEPSLTFCKWKSISLSSINTNPFISNSGRLMDTISNSWHESLNKLDLNKEENSLTSKSFTISDFARNALIND